MSETPAPTASHEAHGHDHEHDWNAHIRTYMIIGGVLFVGTLLTVAAAFWPIFDLRHRWANITLGLLIATVKSSLVALIFMHLKEEKKIIYKFMLFTAVFFAAMLFLILSSQSDPIPADGTGNMRYSVDQP
jgi:cytochrome c oxidase subunit IV